MHTQTHIAIAAAALARPGQPRWNGAVLLGAVIPDLSIFVLWGWAKLNAVPERRIWRELYWSEPWQTLGAIGNSVPLYLVLAAIAWFLLRRSGSPAFPVPAFERSAGGPTPAEKAADPSFALLLLGFSLAALLHLAADFPVHDTDAHRHFWPFTDWRYRAQVSYWRDSAGEAIELAVAGGALLFLWIRFNSLRVRALIAAALSVYFAVPAYFAFVFG